MITSNTASCFVKHAKFFFIEGLDAKDLGDHYHIQVRGSYFVLPRSSLGKLIKFYIDLFIHYILRVACLNEGEKRGFFISLPTLPMLCVLVSKPLQRTRMFSSFLFDLYDANDRQGGNPWKSVSLIDTNKSQRYVQCTVVSRLNRTFGKAFATYLSDEANTKGTCRKFLACCDF